MTVTPCGASYPSLYAGLTSKKAVHETTPNHTNGVYMVDALSIHFSSLAAASLTPTVHIFNVFVFCLECVAPSKNKPQKKKDLVPGKRW